MKIAKQLKAFRPDRVLDVGCGEGQFIAFLADNLGSFNTLTGVDVDADSLNEARQKFPGGKFEFRQAGAGELPFQDASFQMVSISKALHHLPDPVKGLEEMFRVLEKEGFLLVHEMYRDGLSPSQESHKQYHHLRADIDRELGINHHHTFYREDLLALVRGVGLKDLIAEAIQPDDSMALDPGHQQEFVQKMHAWLEVMEDPAIRSQYRRKIEKVEKHIRRHGISRPPLLLMLGRKG